MDDADLKRQFGELHQKLDTTVQLQRRTLQEQQRMSTIQQTILDSIDRADAQLRADKVVITTQAATIVSQADIISGLKAQVADLTAKLGQQNINLDDEVDPDSIHAHLATLESTIGDLASVATSTTGFDFQSGAATSGTPPAVGQNPGVQQTADTGSGDRETVTLSGSDVGSFGSMLGTTAPQPAPGPETTAAAPSTSVLPGTTVGPGALSGVEKAALVDQVVASTNAAPMQVSAAVDAHVAVTDAGGTLDQASAAAATAATASGAGVETGVNIAAAIVTATAPATGQPDAVSQAATVTVPVPDPAKPAGLPDNSVASGSASAASTIGAPPSADVAAVTGIQAPAVSVEGTASGGDPAAVTQAPASPGPATTGTGTGS